MRECEELQSKSRLVTDLVTAQRNNIESGE